jgi:hypothetical protein
LVVRCEDVPQCRPRIRLSKDSSLHNERAHGMRYLRCGASRTAKTKNKVELVTEVL